MTAADPLRVDKTDESACALVVKAFGKVRVESRRKKDVRCLTTLPSTHATLNKKRSRRVECQRLTRSNNGELRRPGTRVASDVVRVEEIFKRLEVKDTSTEEPAIIASKPLNSRNE